jgi:hypothetical protein
MNLPPRRPKPKRERERPAVGGDRWEEMMGGGSVILTVHSVKEKESSDEYSSMRM